MKGYIADICRERFRKKSMMSMGQAGFTLGNPEVIRGEATTLNAGIDITMSSQRLDIAFDVFNKITSATDLRR